MADENARIHRNDGPGSYVAADAGIQLPDERTHAAPGDTYEEVRDNEQLGRPRSEMLHQVHDASPPPDGANIQSDQLGRQVVEDIMSGRMDPMDATVDAANTEGGEYT